MKIHGPRNTFLLVFDSLLISILFPTPSAADLLSTSGIVPLERRGNSSAVSLSPLTVCRLSVCAL